MLASSVWVQVTPAAAGSAGAPRTPSPQGGLCTIMAPAEFFNAAWLRFVPAPRMRVHRADGGRPRHCAMESPMVGERSMVQEQVVGMSRLLAWRAA